MSGGDDQRRGDGAPSRRPARSRGRSIGVVIALVAVTGFLAVGAGQSRGVREGGTFRIGLFATPNGLLRLIREDALELSQQPSLTPTLMSLPFFA